MNRHRASRVVVLGWFVLSAGLAGQARAQTPTPAARAADPGATAIVQALQANPVTAPYPIAVMNRGKQYVLLGKVGTKQIHDAAVQTVIALGYPFRDDLKIDTGEVYRVAARQAAASPPVASVASPGVPYVYPQPLFGYVDNPFYGMEPPLVSYPFGWQSVAAREPLNPALLNAMSAPDAGPAPAQPGGENWASGPSTDIAQTPPGTVEMTLDARGVAVLRGQVGTMAERVAIGQEVARTRGISQVINLLQVGGAAGRPGSDTPPPPPTPAFRAVPAPNAPNAPRPLPERGNEGAAIAVGGDALARRVADAFSKRPALADLSIKVTSRDNVVTLSGRVPSSYEAMLAFRAAERTPGVREAIDHLEFPLPEAEGANPLRAKGRPEDVEPYLLAHVRRQLGDLAHVDQLRVQGDTLELRCTVARDDDIPRVEAALRSIPLLRGFRLNPTFLAD